MNKERTFSIIKPDAVAAGHTGEILSTMEVEGFKIVALRMTRLSRLQAEAFYAVHRERPFYASLVKFMTEGPIVAVALEREDAIAKLREIMGATNPASAMEGTIRRRYAESIERNCIHGSDGPDTAAVELAYFFSTLDLSEY
jgi:nucleoside-diphosphate kinase